MIIKEDMEAVYNNGLIKIVINENKCHPLYAYYNISSQLFNSYIDNVGRTTST
jgi:restriction endonuclease S subunit